MGYYADGRWVECASETSAGVSLEAERSIRDARRNELESAFNQELAWRLELQAKNQMLLEALKESVIALRWFYDSYPHDVTPAGHDKLKRFDKAIKQAEGPAK